MVPMERQVLTGWTVPLDQLVQVAQLAEPGLLVQLVLLVQPG